MGYLIANELDITERSALSHEIPHILLTEQGPLTEPRDALKKARTLSQNQRKFEGDLTSIEHEEYHKVLVEIVNIVLFCAIEHRVE